MDAHLGCGLNNALCQQITAGDAAKDIDENGFYPGVGQNQLKCLGDLVCRRTTTYIQKVGGFPAMQLDHVHGRHSQTGTIDHAADIPLQGNIIEPKLSGGNFPTILLGGIKQFVRFGMPVQGIVIHNQLGIQRQQTAIAGNRQRVDFDHQGIQLLGKTIHALHDAGQLLHLTGIQTKLKSQLSGLKRQKSGAGINNQLFQSFRPGCSQFLNIHAAFPCREKGNSGLSPVHHQRQIQLAGNTAWLLNQQSRHMLALRTGLGGYQWFSKQLLGGFFHSGNTVNDPHPTSFASASGMHLGFHHPGRTAQFTRLIHGFTHRKSGNGAGDRNPLFGQQTLGLILMQIHESSFKNGGSALP